MKKSGMTLVLVAAMSPMLGGCSLGRMLGFRGHGGPAQSASAQAWPEEQLAIGKQRLDQGDYAAAIQAFGNAQLFPEQAANACNGLAVAWLQLGRPDLAERYFKQAIARDPSDPRFQANLMRFYASVAEADVRKTVVETPVLALGSLQDMQLPELVPPVPVRVQARGPQMTRISAREVAISGPPMAAPAPYRAHARTALSVRRKAHRLAVRRPVTIGMASDPAVALPATRDTGVGPAR